MPLYRDRIYPYLVSRMGDPKPIRGLRQKVIPLASGIVLKVGSGAGANFGTTIPRESRSDTLWNQMHG